MDTRQEHDCIIQYLCIMRVLNLILKWITYVYIYLGKSETYADCLRSLFASYVFEQSVQSLKAEGVDFESHLYQPEISSVTGEAMLNIEDHGHVFKRFTQCLRSGSIPGINMKAFADALKTQNQD